MQRKILNVALGLVMGLTAVGVNGQDGKAHPSKLKLDSLAGLEVDNATAVIAEHEGRRSLHLVPLPGHENADESMIAILTGSDFKDGTIEVDVAGTLRDGGPEDMRGFIGVLLRVQSRGDKAENFYIRPLNARCDDQLRRNHSIQYDSSPDYGWRRLRTESPGVYETYGDMVAGGWTHLKIEVSGVKARFYVNGASQPQLIVNDLRLGDSRGQIALWAHTTTMGYFSNLTVK
jgi:hypothetical protein